MSSKVTPSSPMHSPVCRANATTTSMVVRISSNAVTPNVCIPGLRHKSLSFSASETFDATAVVISIIFSAPHALGDCMESIEPSRCQDFVWETMVSQVLNRTPTLAWLARLICLLVRDCWSTVLWSSSSSCPLHVTSHLRSWRGWWCVPPDVICRVT